MKNIRAWLLSLMRLLGVILSMCTFNSASSATCYIVYDKLDTAVYRSTKPPFDLSLPVSDSIALKYPGGYLIAE